MQYNEFGAKMHVVSVSVSVNLIFCHYRDIVKLTAQFMAKNGTSFQERLMQREQRSYQFDFLRKHPLFSYFTKLVEHYRKVAMCCVCIVMYPYVCYVLYFHLMYLVEIYFLIRISLALSIICIVFCCVFQILLPSRELKGKLRQEAEDPYKVCACVLHAYVHMILYSAKLCQGKTLMNGARTKL